jgi:hypothetical protein
MILSFKSSPVSLQYYPGWVAHATSFRGQNHGFRGEFRVGELCILTAKIFLDYPTGSRTGHSNKDGNLEFNYFCQGLAEWHKHERPY